MYRSRNAQALPRTAGGAVDLGAVAAVLDSLDPGRRVSRPRASLSAWLEALAAFDPALPGTAVATAASTLPSVEEPAPFAPPSPSMLASLPPPPPEPVASAAPRSAAPLAEGLVEPSRPPPPPEPSALEEPELRLSLPPLEPASFEAPEVVIPRDVPGAQLRAMMVDVAESLPSVRAEAFELDLIELGAPESDFERMKTSPGAGVEAHPGEADDLEVVDLEEVIELEDVVVTGGAQSALRAPRAVPRAPVLPRTPPPVPRKVQ